MILYFIGCIILFIILFFIYIRIKYRFWAIQPVFHFYDLYYWFVNVGIIRHELPQKNRYTNFKNVNTLVFEDVSKSLLKQFVILIQLNYLRNKDNIFYPKIDNIIPYFNSHNYKSFWSFYFIPEILIDNKTNTTIEEQKLVAVITSRPLHVKMIGIKDGNFDIYYVDYLCVNKNYRNKNIAPQIIQTHEYNQSHKNKDICVSLFKREEELTAIIPLTTYSTYCFSMKKWNQPLNLSPKITLLTGDKQNMYYFYNFVNETSIQKWKMTILPDMGNLIELVSTKNLFIKMLVSNTNIIAAYVFRKTCTFIQKDKEILSCIASIRSSNIDINDFIIGFKNAIWSIIKDNHNFKFCSIEDVSDNNYIINNIKLKTHPIIISPTAYFFYNFAYNPFPSNKILIIN